MPVTSAKGELFGPEFEKILSQRKAEADEFYESITPPTRKRRCDQWSMRQALAGMLWSKQFYFYDIGQWIKDHFPGAESSARSRQFRNGEWTHMVNADILSMPDKWEYPWYAAWDLAFHCVPLAAVDPDFAKQQILIMLKEQYLHPSGQIPAYEWNFGDVNPPVHAWAALYVYHIDKQNHDGEGDLTFLKSTFQKLLVNFTWWVNRKDRSGRNVFEGGFLGLDNIGVFDRSAPLPTGGCLEQADGTAWMAFFSQSMLEIALELAQHDPLYQDFVVKFAEQFLAIGAAMDRVGEHADEMWDEQDGFFYDVLRLPDGTATRLKVRSMVGLLSLCATTVIPPETLASCPRVTERAKWFLDRHPELAATAADPRKPGEGGRFLLALLNEDKLRRVLAIMLDEREFLSPFGIRSLSRRHASEPFVYQLHGGQTFRVDYAPGRNPPSGAVWRQLELARPGLDAGQPSASPRSAQALCLLRRQLQGRMPDRFRQGDEPFPGRQRSWRSPDLYLLSRRGRMPPSGLRRRRIVPNRSELARQYSLLRIFPRRQRRRHRRKSSDRLDRRHRHRHPDAKFVERGSNSWRTSRGQTLSPFRRRAAGERACCSHSAGGSEVNDLRITMTSTTAPESPSDFSMVLGGPLYQLFLRLHIVRAPLDLLIRRMVIISLFAWLPLLALSIFVGRAWGGVKVPFLYDIDAHVRFLIALPLLILAEWVIHIRFRPIIGQFLERNIITPEDRPRYDDIIQFILPSYCAMIVAEVILVLFVIFVGPILWRHQSALEASTWYADVGPGGMHLTLAGIYFRYVALPIFQFMLLRWYFRLFIWCRFLWKVSRLNLNLLPTHPDGAGGLGFLAGSAHAMLPFLLAQPHCSPAGIANHIFFDGRKTDRLQNGDSRLRDLSVTSVLMRPF